MKTTRINKQKKVIKIMVEFYCKKKHNTMGELCDQCEELLEYAYLRLGKCRYGNNKPNCDSCKTHCYKKEMKDRMTEVMKYSGSRMLLHNPKIVIAHFIDGFKYKPK
ncbi:nitrous oxide-stimulated promoter family protein [Hathewaya histolytica]|uniref:nitrous oxide-stimulated promoter family protein n=1 Tax=Hathewaya histolytica TaxID=1498 RepID=UPI003B682398